MTSCSSPTVTDAAQLDSIWTMLESDFGYSRPRRYNLVTEATPLVDHEETAVARTFNVSWRDRALVTQPLVQGT